MADLTYDQLAYDRYVTVGRGYGELLVFETGYWLGQLGAYLDEEFMAEQQWSAAESDWYRDESFIGAIEEGRSDRREHTAEDLFVSAHEWMAGRTWPGGPTPE